MRLPFRSAPRAGRAGPLAALLALALLAPLFAGAPAARAADLSFDQQRFFGHNGISSLAVGDLDGDGDLDIAAGGGREEGIAATLYLNDGRGNLPSADAVALRAPDGHGIDFYVDVALGDFNGDGRLDVAVAGEFAPPAGAGASNLLFLQADGGFAPAIPFGRSDGPGGRLIAGDLDRDGDLDLAQGNGWFGGQPAVYLNDGAGGFPDADIISFGEVGGGGHLALGDLNDDGWLDLVEADDGERSWVYLSDDAGGFRRDGGNLLRPEGLPLGRPDGQRLTSVVLGDLDGDDRLDIVVHRADDALRAFLNDGSDDFFSGEGLRISSGSMQLNTGADIGDLNGDGALDIVLTDFFGLNSIYLNTAAAGGPGDPAMPGFSAQFFDSNVNTTDVVIADLNGDAALDLVTGNGSLSVVLLNSGAGALATRGAKLFDRLFVYAVQTGDLNNDGQLDLVVGDELDGHVIYLSDGGDYGPDPSSSLGEGGAALASLEVVDLDGDTFLDLVGVGQASGEPSASSWIFLNDRTGAFPAERRVPFGPPGLNANDLALGDFDNDGLLDVAVVYSPPAGGDAGSPSGSGLTQVFLNTGDGGLEAGWQGASAAGELWAIEAGDLDGDSDLDLLVGAGEQLWRYSNDGSAGFGAPELIATVGSPTAGAGRGGTGNGLALGDIDGDGDLDVVGTNFFARTLALRNGGSGTFGPVETIANQYLGRPLLADLDDDGDLDLIIEGVVYRNDGAGQFLTGVALSTPDTFIRVAALADFDGDSKLDLITSESTPFEGAPIDGWLSLYYNRLQRPDRLPNGPPQVRLAGPGSYQQTDGALTFSYTLADPEGDPVREVRVFYSLNGGGDWRPAAPLPGTPTTSLPAAPTGSSHSFAWDLLASGFFGQSDRVAIRVEVYAGAGTARGATAPRPQRPYVAAQSAPFPLRGTQVRVVAADLDPAPGALVYRLQAGRSSGALPLSRAGGAPFTTDGQGLLQGRGAVAPGDRLVALAPISATDTFTLYHTSAAPTAEGLAVAPVTTSGVQELTVSPGNPLVLFNLDVSLEWDAGADAQYRARLEEDLRRASAVLYDYTDGQAALGEITVYHDKERWNDAHLRVYATNRLRPNANQGGIVAAPLSETVAVGGEARTLTYEPGQIRMGAVWNRYGEPSGTLGDDWPRTLAHELGHFALFLDDNYLGFDEAGRLVSVASCPGVMADPYIDNASELRPAEGWDELCADTLSNRLTGRSDWETVERFYSFPELSFGLRGPAAFDANPGPGVQPLALTRVRFVEPSALPEPARAPLGAPAIYLTDGQGLAVQPDPGARALLFQENRDRLLDLGTIVLDRVETRGARVGDRLCVFEPARSRLGCEELSAADQQLALREAPGWSPDVAITPVTSRTVEVAVRGVEPGLRVVARLYPVDYPASAGLQLAEGPAGYGRTFSFDEPVLSGYVHVWVDEAQGAAGPRRETVTDFAVGGSPGSNRNRTGQRNNPGSNRNRTAPVLSGDGQAILFTAGDELPAGAFFTLQSLPADGPPAWATPVGQAYRLTASAGSERLLAGSSINIGYLTAEVPPGTELGLAVFFLPPAGEAWERLPTALNAERNEASAPTRGPGQYALMTQVAVRAGWNLLAYPWPDAPTVPEALARLNAARYTTVFGYADDSPDDPWKVYDVGAPPWVNDLARLRYGQGYWVRVEAVAAVASAQPAPAEDAAPAEMLPTPPATFYALVDDLGVAAGEEVVARVGGVACATTRALASGATGGRVAFVVDVPADDGGARAGCGVPGRAVSFESGGRALPLSATWLNGRPQDLRAPFGAPRASVYLPLVRR